ncbi:MAG: hypothetical protein ACOVOV_12595, partial [Dolichospermum sp.]
TLYGSVIIPTGSLTVSGSTKLGIIYSDTHIITGSVSINQSGSGIPLILNGRNLTTSTANKVFENIGSAGTSVFSVRSNGIVYISTGQLYFEGNGLTSRYFDSRIQLGTVAITTASSGANTEIYGGLKVYSWDGGSVNNEVFRIAGNGNVGIGLTTPTTKLHISGASNTGLLEIDSPAVNNILYVSGSGNIGINTNAPAYNLDVSGTLRVSSFPYFTAYATSVQRVQFNNGTVAGNLGYVKSSTNGIIQLADSSETDFNRLQFGGSTSLFPALQRSGSSLCVVDAAGGTNTSLLVGLSGSAYGSTGTSNGKLTINNTSGNNGLAIRIGETGYQLAVRTTTNDAIGTEFVWYDGATITFLQYGGTLGARLGASGFAQFRANNYNPDATATIHTGNSNLERFRVTSTGLIGIGTSSPSASLHVAGTTRLSGSFNTATSGSILTVIGSGSTQPIFTVQGSQGELFSITDSLTGSLFSVNDISGLPILEVFSDNTTLIGDYQDPMLITTKKVTMTNSGSFIVYSLPTASYDTAFFDYSIKSGSNGRAGQIMAIQSGSSVNFTETTTTDFGSTTAVSFTVLVSGSNMVLTGSAATGSWTIKTIVRGL